MIKFHNITDHFGVISSRSYIQSSSPSLVDSDVDLSDNVSITNYYKNVKGNFHIYVDYESYAQGSYLLTEYQLKGHYLFYIKVAFLEGEFRMAGTQGSFIFNNSDDFEDFKDVVSMKLNTLFDLYCYSLDDLNHIIVSFIPVDLNIVNKFKIVKSEYEYVNEFVADNLDLKKFESIPFSKDFNFFGSLLETQVVNDEIVGFKPNNDIVSIKDLSYQFEHNPLLKNLPLDTLFFYMKLRGKDFIVVVQSLDDDVIRKVRINLKYI